MLLWILAAVAAFFVKGLCGFANTMVFTAIASYGAANANISPVDLVLGYPTNIILMWKGRKELDTKIWLPLAALVLAGSIPGALLLKHANAGAIKVVFGAVIILLGAEMLLRGRKNGEKQASKALLAGIGLLAGLLCGLFGIGALLAAYVSRATKDARSFKANISAVFVVENTFRIASYAVLGLLTLDTLKMVLLLIPFALLGLFAGMKSSSIMDDKLVSRIVAVLLMLSGVSLILANL